jgi:DNA-binding PadR family transcriptional regulator
LATSFQDRAFAEMRRGVLQLAVLSLLREATYGYELLNVLERAGLKTEEGTLYPVLRRLEKEGLLASEWNTSGSRPRKYYRTTDRGREVQSALLGEWTSVNRALTSALASAGDDHGADEHQEPRAS